MRWIFGRRRRSRYDVRDIYKIPSMIVCKSGYAVFKDLSFSFCELGEWTVVNAEQMSQINGA